MLVLRRAPLLLSLGNILEAVARIYKKSLRLLLGAIEHKKEPRDGVNIEKGSWAGGREYGEHVEHRVGEMMSK